MSNHDQVVQALQWSLTGTGQQRKEATSIIEGAMASVDQNSGYTRCLLDIATNPQAPEGVRQSAAVNFKNLIKNTWDPTTSDHIMNDEAKAAVRESLFDLVLRADNKTVNSLEDSLKIVCDVDFPHNWPNLLDLACGRLQSLFNGREVPPNSMRNAERCISGINAAINKYGKMNELTNEIAPEYTRIHATLVKPILSCLNAAEIGINNAINNQHIDDARAACAFLCKTLDCLHTLIWLDLSHEYEKDFENFARAYSSFLRLRCPPIEQSNKSDSLAEVKIRTLTILSLHIQKYAEESRQFVSTLANDAWNVLQQSQNNNQQQQSASSSPEDAVVIAVIQFIERVAQVPSLNHVLEPMIEPIIQTCVMPNVELDDFDVDNFEDDPQDYIEHDVEGTDQWTRRRAATELIRALIDAFYHRVGPIFTNALQQMLQGYHSDNKKNWKNKDSAMFLVTALAARGSATAQRGTAGALTNLVNVPDFYSNEVMSELKPANGTSASDRLPTPVAVLKSSAIRFVSTFRQHIPLSEFPTLFSLLAGWVSNDNVVLFSYAAHAIDRLLSDTRINSNMIERDLAGQLLQCLCIRLSKTANPNEHLTRAIASVMKTANGDAVSNFIGDVTMCLHSYLKDYIENPGNAQFTHFLFESIAWMIRSCPQFAPQMKDALWQMMMHILKENIIEMMPYVLQIVAQMLDTIPSNVPTPPEFLQLLEPLLSPILLGEKGNIPAVVRLVCSFLRQGGAAISQQQGPVTRMFEVCGQLIASKQTDTEGFMMLVGMLINLSTDACDRFITDIWHTIMQRLQKSRTPKFEKALILGVAAIAAKYGGENLAKMLESIQQGLFPMLCNRFIFLNGASASSKLGKKCALMLLVEVAEALVKSGRLRQEGPKMYLDLVKTGVRIIAGGAQAGATIVNRQFGGDNNSGGMVQQSSRSNFEVNQGNNNFDGNGNSNNNNNNSSDPLASANSVTVELMSSSRTTNLADTGFTNSYCPLQGAQRDADDPFPQVQNPANAFANTVRQHMNNDQQLQNAVQNELNQHQMKMLMNA